MESWNKELNEQIHIVLGEKILRLLLHAVLAYKLHSGNRFPYFTFSIPVSTNSIAAKDG